MRLKKITLSAILLFFTFTPSIFAHSGLMSSTPHDGETINEEVEHVILIFNTPIETTSTLKITDELGKALLIEIIVDDKQMMGMFNTPLKDGKYQVAWKIIGEDGHPIEGKYSFIVDSSQIQEEEPMNSMESHSDISDKEIPEETILLENKSDSTIKITQIVLASILVAVIAGTVVWLFRRGGK